MFPSVRVPPSKIQSRLLVLAAGFMVAYASALTISTAARMHSWQVDYQWGHWLVVIVWSGTMLLAHRAVVCWLPDSDPYLLPLAALLTGWGTLTIWRLDYTLGIRQTAWLAVVIGIFILGLRLPPSLAPLRQYKYVWLSAGLGLTALTLFLGTNPMGAGPRLWLGCCGVYFQPSEPLKLLMVVYLAAYLADRQPYLAIAGTRGDKRVTLLPLLAPTLVMVSLAILLLIAQRDLGTASIFLIIYTVVVFVASGNTRILVIGGVMLVAAGAAGYLLFDIVKLRIDAWLNPWIDPSGGSYQIVQSLIAIANGGITGRGPGLGSPALIPIAHSDFIFSAISEEAGLIGAIGLLIVLAVFSNRGLRAALNAEDAFKRYLAAGLTAHLIIQSLLIIAGNIRMLPLTGVTLPFVSYGGSSLLTSYLSLLLLLHISRRSERVSHTLVSGTSYRQLGTWLILGLGAAGLVMGWWSIYRAPGLIIRTDNPRRSISDRYVRRGSLLSRGEEIISESILEGGEYKRYYRYTELGVLAGYNHPLYGQSGLESSLDEYLRGTTGNPVVSVWWNRLLYGMPPPGLDVQLSLDLDLQRIADRLLTDKTGALVLLNANSGEILVMASHPGFDANTLAESWNNLVTDDRAPLLDRSALGRYPIGSAAGPFLLALSNEVNNLPVLPSSLEYTLGSLQFTCSSEPIEQGWGEFITTGCPNPVVRLGTALGGESLLTLYDELGFYTAPQIRIPTNTSVPPLTIIDPASASLGYTSEVPDLHDSLLVSPLQMAIAAGTISNGGTLPAPHLVITLIPSQDQINADRTIVPALDEAGEVFSQQAADQTATMLSHREYPFWQTHAIVPNGLNATVTWYLGGTLPGWQGAPLAIAVALEEGFPSFAEEIGQIILQTATQNMLP